MALLVDGDACPDLPAIRDLAWKYQVEMTVFVDYAHFIQDDYFRTILCEVGSDSVDLVLLKQVQANDLVITQDYGLASLVLSKGAKVLHISGKVIDDNNIDTLQELMNPKIDFSEGKNILEGYNLWKEVAMNDCIAFLVMYQLNNEKVVGGHVDQLKELMK